MSSSPPFFRTSLSKYLLLLTFLAVLGFVLRLPGSGLGYWRDEMHVYYAAHLPSLSVLVEKLPTFEYGPPLFYALMWVWVKLTGGSEVLFTLPLMLFGIALIPAVYCLGSLLHSRGAGAIAAAVATCAPMAVYWSQEVRPYQFAALTSCLTAATYLLALRTPQRKYLAFFVLAGIVQAYTHYTCLMLLALLLAITSGLWLRKPDRQLLSLLACFPLIGIGFLPWSGVLLSQMGSGVPDYIKPALTSWPLIFFANLVRSLPLPPSLNEAIISLPFACVFLLLALAAMLLVYWQRLPQAADQRRSQTILTACFLAEAAIVQYLTPYSTSRYLYPVMPFCWCLGACLFAETLKQLPALKPALKIGLACAAIALCLGIAGADIYSDCNDVSGYRSGIQPLVFEAATAAPEQQKETAYLVVPDFNSITFAYYARQAGLISRIHGMPAWDDLNPFSMPKTSAQWREPDLAAVMLARIAGLGQKEHIKQLRLVCDHHLPDTDRFPARAVLSRLVTVLSRQYKFLGVRTYPGLRDTEDVLTFEIH